MTLFSKNIHSFGLRFILVSALFIFAPANLQAAGLDDEKAALTVGEQWDGYLGTVQSNTSPELRALVSSINEKRRAKYMSIAENNNLSLSDVEQLAAKKTFEKTRPGHMVKTQSGTWRKK